MNESSPRAPDHREPEHDERPADPDEGRSREQHEKADRRESVEPPATDEARRSRGGRRWFGLVVLAMLFAGLGWGGLSSMRRSRAAVDARAALHDIVPTVQTAKIQAAAPTIELSLPAQTLAYADAQIYARANGYIDKRDVDIGDHVKTGDVLAVLTAPELDYEIAQAEEARAQASASVQQNEANRNLAQVTNNRSSTLVRQGWVTRQQGDQDRLGLAAQQAAVGAARANTAALEGALNVLKQQRDYLSVIAPFDGIVTRRNVDIGDLVQSGQTLMFTMQKTDVIRVQVNVPQDQAFDVAPGAGVTVRVPELPGRAFEGKVTRMSVSFDANSRTLLAEAEVPNPDGALRAGAYCVITLHIPRKQKVLILPSAALIFNGGGQQAMVVENGEGHLRKLNVSRDNGSSLEVVEGLKAGETVVLNPTADLADGRRVRVASPPSTPSG